MQYVFFVNSLAKINRTQLLSKAEKYFSNYEIFYSKYAGHIEELVETYLNNNLNISITTIIIGGDGTLNEACNGIVKSNHKNVFLGYIPAGTANVISYEFFIPKDIEKCFEIIKKNNWREINVSRAGNRYFLFTCGIGFDGYVVKNINSNLKNKTGKFAFIVSGINALKYHDKFSEFKVIIDDEKITCCSLIVNRIKRYAGNFKLFKNAYIFSDYFEVAIFKKIDFFEIGKFFLGNKPKQEFKIAKKIQFIENMNIPVQIDGEYLNNFPEVLEISEKKVKFVLP